MTHPITPPPELVQQWYNEAAYDQSVLDYWVAIATQAARWGADQQLDEDARWLDTNALFSPELTITPPGNALRHAMRPKPPSLKEQALADLDTLVGRGRSSDTIRRALDLLPDDPA